MLIDLTTTDLDTFTLLAGEEAARLLLGEEDSDDFKVSAERWITSLGGSRDELHCSQTPGCPFPTQSSLAKHMIPSVTWLFWIMRVEMLFQWRVPSSKFASEPASMRALDIT